MNHSTKKPTAAQRRRLDAISKMRCVVAVLRGERQPNKTEIHHLVDRGNRRASGGHDATIPLSRWAHRGITLRGKTIAQMTEQYGPSMALQGKAFTARYGTQRELLAIVDNQLESVTN